MDMLINLILVIILEDIHMSNDYTVHLKLTSHYKSIISQQSWAGKGSKCYQ